MAGEAVTEVPLEASGLFRDRLYAFESSGAPAGMLRLAGQERRAMLAYRPALRPDGRVEVRVPSGEAMPGRVAGPGSLSARAKPGQE